MARTEHSALDELIRAVPEHILILDQPCSDKDLCEIGRHITDWQTIAPHLNLSPADEEGITTYLGNKRIKMLRRWREKYGSGATYRNLADSFQKTGRADLIDKIRAVLTAPKQPPPSPTSTLSPHSLGAKPGYHSTAAGIPDLSNSTQPIAPRPTSQPLPVPIQHRDRAHHDAVVSSPKSQKTEYPTSDQDEDPDDLTSQEEATTVQSYNERSCQPTEEEACRSVSPQQWENFSTFTGTSPYEEWCCHLKYDGGSQVVMASGVIAKLNYPLKQLHIHLPGLRPMKKFPEKYGSVQTPYILITCHHVIPGMHVSYLKGWNLNVGLGRKLSKLQGLVCGAVSCCGENGFISSGSHKPNKETAVFSSHPKGCCLLKLDFTILFLNPAFEKLVLQLNKKGVQTKLPEINLNFLEAKKHKQLQLYQRERRHRVVPDSHRVGVQPQDSSLGTLKDEICAYKALQVIHYTQSESQLTQFCSGSPLVSCDLDSETLVGIHVEDNDGFGSGVTIYGIFQLLKGQFAAFFSIMEILHARRKWPFRWAHLLTHTLESGLKEKPVSYLLEILHLLLTDMDGVCVIELRVSDSLVKHKSALELLSAVFKQFDRYGCEEVAEAVSEMYKENQFHKTLQQLLVNLLHYLLKTRDEIDLVKEYFVCYNSVLNFECKGKIQAVLSKDDVTDDLQRLRSMYSSLDTENVIERNFHDIQIQLKYESQIQLMKCKYEFQIQQLKAQLQKLEEKLEAELLETKRTHGSQIEQLKEQLQKLQDEITTDKTIH